MSASINDAKILNRHHQCNEMLNFFFDNRLEGEGISLTCAFPASLRATMYVLLNMSPPGPNEKQASFRPSDSLGHVLLSGSHGSPEISQRGPFVLGDTSPRLLDANAATNFV